MVPPRWLATRLATKWRITLLRRLFPSAGRLPTLRYIFLIATWNPYRLGSRANCMLAEKVSRVAIGIERSRQPRNSFLTRLVPEPSARLYKTGDLARYRSDGNIEFLGRRDDQVKIRGFRIELGEIEAALTKHPALKAAAVVVREESPGDKRLVAYATLRENSWPTAADLRSFLRATLPEYMLPWKFEFLVEMPLTPSGKVDRRGLPASGNSRSERNGEYVAPRTDLERKLARIWAEVLKLDRVSIHDNFFDLGGYSLLAVKLIKAVEKFSIGKISLASLFRAPTISELAMLLSTSHRREGADGIIPIQPEGSRPPFFCVGAGPLFRPLALRLGSDQPFLGLGIARSEMQALRAPFLLEDIAACLVRKLVSAQPTGPYFIGGWCASGLLAYEVAQQLRAKGENVAALVLFETVNNVKRREYLKSQGFRSRFRRQVGKLRRFRKNQSKLSWQERWADFCRALDSRQKKMRGKLWHSYHKFRWAIDKQFGDRSAQFFKTYIAILNYRPKPYPGRVIQFWSATSELEPMVQSRELSWHEQLVGHSEVHYVPGSHRHMFLEPNVAVLATILERCLSPAREIDRKYSSRILQNSEPTRN